MARRQTCPAGRIWQFRQQLSFRSSHTAPALYLQVAPSQHGSLAQSSAEPQSHSSPVSLSPFPQMFASEFCVVLVPGGLRHWPVELLMVAQMVLMLHGEKSFVAIDSDGFIINRAPASHTVSERGQHWPCLFTGHVFALQSCIAPKPCPIS